MIVPIRLDVTNETKFKLFSLQLNVNHLGLLFIRRGIKISNLIYQWEPQQ